jgi:hypothetical protein
MYAFEEGRRWRFMKLSAHCTQQPPRPLIQASVGSIVVWSLSLATIMGKTTMKTTMNNLRMMRSTWTMAAMATA